MKKALRDEAIEFLAATRAKYGCSLADVEQAVRWAQLRMSAAEASGETPPPKR
jgi:hypothetical protein